MSSTSGLLTRITQTPGHRGGRPCIRGMRIRVTDILEMLAKNVGVLRDLELRDAQNVEFFECDKPHSAQPWSQSAIPSYYRELLLLSDLD